MECLFSFAVQHFSFVKLKITILTFSVIFVVLLSAPCHLSPWLITVSIHILAPQVVISRKKPCPSQITNWSWCPDQNFNKRGTGPIADIISLIFLCLPVPFSIFICFHHFYSTLSLPSLHFHYLYSLLDLIFFLKSFLVPSSPSQCILKNNTSEV